MGRNTHCFDLIHWLAGGNGVGRVIVWPIRTSILIGKKY